MSLIRLMLCCFFFFNDTATTEIYTLSLHDALPISTRPCGRASLGLEARLRRGPCVLATLSGTAGCAARYVSRLGAGWERSEEHTSELQSRLHLVCRLLLEKKK